LRATGFVDLGRRLLSDLGLDPPEMTIEIATLSAKTRVLRFGRANHAAGEWRCTMEGQPVVWKVEAAAVDYFDSAVEILLDPNLTRIPAAAVDAVTLALDGRELRVWREKSPMGSADVWKVCDRPRADAAFSPALPADRKRIDDLLGRVGGIRIQPFLAGQTLAPGELRGSILVQAGDEKQGANVGAETGTLEKGRAVRCQRAGDSIAGLVDPAVLDLLRTPLEDLESLLVIDLPEIEQTSLELSGAGVARRFVRGSKGLWTPRDVPYEARELRDVLDGLLILRAKRHLGVGSFPPLDAAVSVKLTNLTGATALYSVGLAPEAAEGERVQVECGGRRSVLQDQGFHRRLLAVLGR